MSAVRFDVWSSKIEKKMCTSSLELEALPPITDAFKHHVYRAHFQAALGRAVLDADPPVI